MSNIIRTVIDNKGKAWHYFEGTFWSVTEFNSKMFMLAAGARLDGNIDVNVAWGEVNSCDVEECEQRHIDFVNAVFGTKFKLLGATDECPIGTPSTYDADAVDID